MVSEKSGGKAKGATRAVPFLVEVRPTPGSSFLHSATYGDNAVDMSFGDLKEQVWTRISDVLEILSDGASKLKDDFELDEVSVSLGLTVKGKLAFLAEASGQGVFQLKLKRKKASHK